MDVSDEDFTDMPPIMVVNLKGIWLRREPFMRPGGRGRGGGLLFVCFQGRSLWEGGGGQGGSCLGCLNAIYGPAYSYITGITRDNDEGKVGHINVNMFKKVYV